MATSVQGTKRRGNYAFSQFAAIRRYQPALSFSPDGAEIAYSTNTSGQFNIWRQSTAGGYPHQLTLFSDNSVRDLAWSPDGKSILFIADHQGDEFHQLYVIPARGGEPQQLTHAEQVQHHLAEKPWSPDGRTIAYAGNDREPTDQDLLLRDLNGSEVGRPLADGGLYFSGRWSPDGRRLTVVKMASNTDMDIYVLDVETGEKTLTTEHDDERVYLPGPWAADGSGFYLLTNEGREFTALAYYDLNSGERTWVETPEWDVEGLALSEDGKTLVWVVNEDGYSTLHARDLSSGADLDLPTVPRGEISSLTMAPSGDKLAMMLLRAVAPTEIVVMDLNAGTVTQLTHSFLGGINPNDLIEPESIRFPTHDGRQIPAFLYRPEGDGPFPVVLSIHGGPESQERPIYLYSGLYQYLLDRGIGVLAPNVRGSSGYGLSYQTLIHHDWGGDELKDFEAAVKYLHSLDWVDNERIGVFGGSFGGFATLSCVSRLPDYWAAAVDIVGPSNLVTFAKAVPPTWLRMMAKWVGDPDTEADFMMERSPITYVDQIKTPLFVIQGANDPRVVKAESDQIVARLRERGVDVRYDVYEDEGHGFTKRSNELKAIGDTAAFLEHHLLGDEHAAD